MKGFRPAVIRSIIRREYLERVRSKQFVFSTLSVPLLMALTVAIPVAIMVGGGEDELTVAVVDGTGILADQLVLHLEEAGYATETVSPNDTTLDHRVLAGSLFGYVVVDGRTLSEGTAVFRSGISLSPVRRFGIQAILARAVMAEQLQGMGEGAQAWNLLSGDGLNTTVLDEGEMASDIRSARQALGFLGAFVLYGTIILYGQMIRRSVQEEKNNRIVEILLCSIRPSELMLGKVVGVGAVGLTQVMVWVSALLAIILGALPAIVTLIPEAAGLRDALEVLPGAGIWIFFLINFLLGYLLFSSLFAASGAMATGDEETNHADLPLMILVMVPFMYMVATQEKPDTVVSLIMSLVPFFSPVLMFNRAMQGLAAPWEVILSLVLMALTVLLVARVAGRIYRVGILMKGKSMTLPEIWRWTKAAGNG